MANTDSTAVTGLLAELATAPELDKFDRCRVLTLLVMAGDPRGIELAVEAAAEERTPPVGCFWIVDALAQLNDSRAPELFAIWAAGDEHSRAERKWIARVLSAPEQVLGVGLNAHMVMSPEFDPLRRKHDALGLLFAEHPLVLDCLAVLLDDMTRNDIHAVAETLDEDRLSSWQDKYELAAKYAADARDFAARELVRRGDTRGLSCLIAALEANRIIGPYSRTETFQDIANLDDPRVADLLVKFAPDLAETRDRVIVIDRLVKDNDPRAGALLAKWATDEDLRYDAADWIVRRLAELRDPRLIDIIEKQDAKNPFSIQWATQALSMIGDNRSADLLARWANDATLESHARRAAAQALLDLDETRGERILATWEDDKTLSAQDHLWAQSVLHPVPEIPQTPRIQLLLEPLATSRRDLRRIHREIRRVSNHADAFHSDHSDDH